MSCVRRHNLTWSRTKATRAVARISGRYVMENGCGLRHAYRKPGARAAKLWAVVYEPVEVGGLPVAGIPAMPRGLSRLLQLASLFAFGRMARGLAALAFLRSRSG